MKIHQLKLRLSNAYLLQGERAVLVDSGSPGDLDVLRSKLRSMDVQFSDLALIVHTHVHSDHMGCTAAILREADCPVAYHPAEQVIVDRGSNGELKGVGLRGAIIARVFNHTRFDTVNADFSLENGMRLSEFGCDATILATPGHTPGSISIITSDGNAVIGDVIMGGYMGGLLMPTKPNYHYFADDVSQAMLSLESILTQTNGTLYVGHGGPIRHASAVAWRQSQRRKSGG